MLVINNTRGGYWCSRHFETTHPKAVSLTAHCLITLFLIYSLCFCNSADRTTTSALFLVIDNIEGGYWYNCYIKTTYPSAVLLIDICLII